MTFQELCNAVMLKATGKATILSPDNAKWKKILGIANLYQNAWLNEPGQKWNSRYDRAYEVGSISDEDAYELDETIEEISTARGDQIYIETEDGNRIKYDLVDYDDLQNYPAGKYCAVVGNNLVFNHTFDEESPEYGGTIFAPVYLGIEELTGKDDDIVVDEDEEVTDEIVEEEINYDDDTVDDDDDEDDLKDLVIMDDGESEDMM